MEPLAVARKDDDLGGCALSGEFPRLKRRGIAQRAGKGPAHKAGRKFYAAVYAEGLRFLRESSRARKILFVNAHKYQMPFRQKILEELKKLSGFTFGKELLPFSFEEIRQEPASLKSLAARGMPDALFAVSDYYIVKLLELAAKECPALLSLPKAGVFNMLYSSFPGHEFPSVPLNLTKMWKNALALSGKERNFTMIEPEKIRI